MFGKSRKKVVRSISEKYAVLQRLDAGETASQLAVELGVGTRTFSDY